MDSHSDTKNLPFYTLLEQGLLIAAFNRLRRYGEKKLLWELTDELDTLRRSYLYMIRYALSGTPDPKRDEIKGNIINRLVEIYDSMRRRADSSKQPDIYFSTLRASSKQSIDALLIEYKKQSSGSIEFDIINDNENKMSRRLTLEGLERDIFNYIWTAYPLDSNSVAAITRLLHDESISSRLKSLVVSALTLGNMRYFDDNRFMLLADVYQNESNEYISLTALTGLLLSMATARLRPISRQVKNRLASLKELAQWPSDLNSVTLELVRTIDTKRISDTMTDYFTNTFSKVGDQVKKSIRDLSKIDDLAELEENPEWMEMLEKTGIADKMKELTEIQEEGGDVFLQPFRQLKSFPFFYEVSNWFLPFSTTHTAVEKIDSDGLFSEMVAQTPFLCDNDKYSLMLSMSNIPEEQRRLMLSQLEAGNMGMAQEAASSMNLDSDRRRRIINKAIQTLYRFFLLFRCHKEFVNPFESDLNLASLPVLADEFSNNETLNLIGEFYFRHKYYRQALPILLLIEQNAMPDAQLYQKIGYCKQHVGDITGALEYYERAELIDSRSSWTIRRIAQCLTLLSLNDKALPYWHRLNELNPDSVKTLLAEARCLIALHRYNDALPILYQVNYLDETNEEALRQTAWCHFALGHKDKADKVVFADNILNAHLLLVEGKIDDAINLYASGIESDDDFNRFTGAIATDFEILQQYGLTHETRDLLIEAVSAVVADRQK